MQVGWLWWHSTLVWRLWAGESLCWPPECVATHLPYPQPSPGSHLTTCRPSDQDTPGTDYVPITWRWVSRWDWRDQQCGPVIYTELSYILSLSKSLSLWYFFLSLLANVHNCYRQAASDWLLRDCLLLGDDVSANRECFLWRQLWTETKALMISMQKLNSFIFLYVLRVQYLYIFAKLEHFILYQLK